jgi:cytochrome c peroxidase
VRIDGPNLSLSSDAQNPGDAIIIEFDQPGQYQAMCGIHPEMRLAVTVEPAIKAEAAAKP